MAKKLESENEKYIRLYERYKVLLSNLDQKVDHAKNAACSLVLSVVILVAGEMAFRIKFENGSYIIAMATGWIAPVLPSITNRLKLQHIEPQLLKIANKNCINIDMGEYNDEYSYEDSKHNALEYHYNYVKELNNTPVKKRGSK